MLNAFTKIANKVWNVTQEIILAAMVGGTMYWIAAVLLYGQGIVGSFAFINMAKSGINVGILLGLCRGIKPLGMAGSTIIGFLMSLVVWASVNLVPIMQRRADVADTEHLNAYFMFIFPSILIAGLMTGGIAYFLSRASRGRVIGATRKQIQAHGKQEAHNG